MGTGGYQLQPYDPSAAARAVVAAAMAKTPAVPNSTFVDPMRPIGGNGVPRPILGGGRDPSSFGGGGLPGTGGNFGQREREMQQYGRGSADLTLHNLMAAGKIAASLMGPMGPFMGARNLINNPSPFTGFVGPQPGGLPSGMTLAQAQTRDRGHEAYGGGGRGAVDSHGQVRGGGTGSRSGGITAGGPR
jgi:hypothetical protein